MPTKRSLLFAFLFLASLNRCQCNDQLASAIGEISLELCDRGEACGCDTLTDENNTIEFETPAQGTSSRRVLRLENKNLSTKLTVHSINLYDDSSFFTVTSVQVLRHIENSDDIQNWDPNSGAFFVEPAGYAEIVLTYTPHQSGEHAATLTIRSDSATNSSWAVRLKSGGGSSETCIENGDCGDQSQIDFGIFSDAEISLDNNDILGRPVALGQQAIQVTNTGREAMLITIELTDDGIPERQIGEFVGTNGVFFLGETSCTVLEAHDTLIVPVEYRPSTAGRHEGEVVIAGFGAPVHITLEGRVVGPHICFRTEDSQPDDALLQFGSEPNFNTPQNGDETRSISVINCGYDAPLELSQVSLTPQTAQEYDSTLLPWTTATLAPNEEQEIPIKLTPNAMSLVGSSPVGRVLFATNDALRPTTAIDLMARIAPPAQCTLVLSPSPLDFGWVASDEAGVGDNCSLPLPGCEELISRTRPLTLTNIGALACEDITLSQPQPDNFSANMFRYHPSNNPPLPLTLQPSESSQPIDIIFRRTPSEQRSRHFAKIALTHRTSQYTDEIVLQAQGGGSPTCALDFQPVTQPSLFCPSESLAFGSVNIGNTKSIDLRIMNTGSQDCVISNIGFSMVTSDVFSYSSSALPGTIPVGDTAIITVVFQPLPTSNNDPFAEMPFLCGMNSLEIAANSGPNGSSQTESVSLSGKGTRPDIDVIPGEIDFGLVTVGCCSDWKRVAIYNSGDGILSIDSIGILANSNTGFETSSAEATTLSPSTSTEFEVRYCARDVGEVSGIVEIQSTDDNEEYFTVPLRAEGTLNSNGRDTFQLPERPLVDVLLAIDDSGSMVDEQDSLANNFSSFITSASDLNTDYHIGVVTTDSESEQAGHLYACSGNPLWVTDGGSVANQQRQFGCNVKVTDSNRPNSDLKESPLQAARMALDYPNIDDVNDGFYRDDAKLYVILVTDEEDQSDGTAQLYVDFFRNLKGHGNTDLLNISAIAGPPPSGCDTADANQKDYDAVTMVGGQFRSICSADWTDLVNSLGLDVFNARRQFPLSRSADSATITIERCTDNEQESPSGCQTIPYEANNGWTYDGATNSALLHGLAIPGPNDHIIITYEAICY